MHRMDRTKLTTDGGAHSILWILSIDVRYPYVYTYGAG